jgi:hypothetical protein
MTDAGAYWPPAAPFLAVTEEFKSWLKLLLNWLICMLSTLDMREMVVLTTQGLLPVGLAVWPQSVWIQGPSGLPELLHEFSPLLPSVTWITMATDITAYLTNAKNLVLPEQVVGLADIIFNYALQYAPSASQHMAYLVVATECTPLLCW